MNCSEFLMLTLTLALVLITAFYVWVTYRILRANERSVKAIRDQSIELTRLNVYDKRLKVYDAIISFIGGSLALGTTDNEKLTEMLRETRHAKFLFPVDEDLKGYIDTLYRKGLDLEYKEKEIHAEPKVRTRERLEKLLEESSKLKDWFNSQYDTVDKKFGKYLQL